MSLDPELNPYNLMKVFVDVTKPLGPRPSVPRFAEMLNNLRDRLVPPPHEIRIDRDTHAELEHAISQVKQAIRSEDWRGLRNFHNSARDIFRSTKLPRIAHLVTRPGSLDMIFRPKYDGRVEIMTDYMRDEVVYRITS